MNDFKTNLDSIHRLFLQFSVEEQEQALSDFTTLLQELNEEHYRRRVQDEATKSVAGEAERILMERFSNDWTSLSFPDSVNLNLMGNCDFSDCFNTPTTSKPKEQEIEQEFDVHGLSDTINLLTTTSKYKCFSCSYIGTNRKALYRHGIQTDHQTKFIDTSKTGAFACQLCNFSTNRKFNLDRHMQRAHFSIRNHICEACSARFKDKDTLRGHLRNVHKITMS